MVPKNFRRQEQKRTAHPVTLGCILTAQEELSVCTALSINLATAKQVTCYMALYTYDDSILFMNYKQYNGNFLFPLLDCKECAVSTEPVYGYHLRWWRSIPHPLRASCFSMSGE